MSNNVLGISEVPSIARNLGEVLAKPDMHLLYAPDRNEEAIATEEL